MAMHGRPVQTAVVISIFSILGAFFISLRLWTRLVIIRAPGYEDWVLVLSWLCAVVTVVCIGLQVLYGLGTHSSELSDHQNTQIAINVYISISTYCASIGLTKLAILMQYKRVFPTRRFQIWTWAFIAIIVGYTIATVAACIFVCWPVQKFWKPALKGTCIDTFASWFSNAIINIITDLMIIILPMPVVSRLRLPRKQKWLLMGVFAFGVVVCVISIVRLHSLFVITHSTDSAYDNAPVAAFSVVETNVALICACLPTLRPLLVKWFPGISNSTAANTGSGGYNGSHGRKRSSVLPSFVDRSIHMNSLSTKKGAERLDDESVAEAEDDKIKVVTRVDVRISQGGKANTKDERESSTESLFRDTKYAV